jgi:hypothetical protein
MSFVALIAKFPSIWHGLHRKQHAVEMGSGVMIYMPSSVMIDSGIQKLINGGSQTAWCLHKPTFIFFKMRRVGTVTVSTVEIWGRVKTSIVRRSHTPVA